MFRNYSIFLMLLSLSILFSCATKKIVSKKIAIEDNSEKIISEIRNGVIEYNNLSYRFKGDCFFLGQNYNFNGIIRIKKDSIIWMSVRLAMGVEIARIIFTEHRIKMRSKIAGVDVDENYSFLKDIAGVKMNYKLIQTIFTDNLNINSNRIKIVSSGKDYCIRENIQFIGEKKFIDEKYCFDPNTFKMSNMELYNKEENYKISVNYFNYIDNNDIIFPGGFRMELSSKNDSINGNLKITNLVTDKANMKFPYKEKLL